MEGLPITRELKLSNKEYALLADLIYRRSGIALGDNKKELVKARLMKRLKFHGLKSFGEYYELLLRDKTDSEIVETIDAISTNVTSFFREKQHFDYLSKIVLPNTIEQKKRIRKRKIRIWCAAASTGEEPYCIMFTLLEYLKTTLGWDIKELATDISTKVLAKAQEGVYEHQRMRGISPFFVDKYFDKKIEGKEKFYKVKDEIRNLVVFRRLNLMMERFPFSGKFDFIFCRNVMIYFDKPTQEKLVNKMAASLETGGHLFIGHSESLAGFAKDNLVTVAPAAFQKIR